MGPEFSGLERPRDFVIAISVAAGLVLAAMLFAFIAFGWWRKPVHSPAASDRQPPARSDGL
jgi:hypothetical protein